MGSINVRNGNGIGMRVDPEHWHNMFNTEQEDYILWEQEIFVQLFGSLDIQDEISKKIHTVPFAM